MKVLQGHIDGLCANFTVDSLCGLVRTQLAAGQATIDDITRAITEADVSLDIGSAKGLAEAAVDALSQSGEVTVQGVDVRSVSVNSS